MNKESGTMDGMKEKSMMGGGKKKKKTTKSTANPNTQAGADEGESNGTPTTRLEHDAHLKEEEANEPTDILQTTQKVDTTTTIEERGPQATDSHTSPEHIVVEKETDRGGGRYLTGKSKLKMMKKKKMNMMGKKKNGGSAMGMMGSSDTHEPVSACLET